MSDALDVIYSGQFKPPAERQVARLTTILNVYHILPGEDPRQFQYPSDRPLTLTDVSPYQRTINVDENITDIDFGWIEPEQMGSILLFNRSGMGGKPGSIPKKIETGAEPSILIPEYNQIVPPTAQIIIVPLSFSGLRVKSSGGVARLEYVGIPK